MDEKALLLWCRTPKRQASDAGLLLHQQLLTWQPDQKQRQPLGNTTWLTECLIGNPILAAGGWMLNSRDRM